MKNRVPSTLLAIVFAVTLNGCGNETGGHDDHDHDHGEGEHSHDGPATRGHTQPETEAFYGEAAKMPAANMTDADQHNQHHQNHEDTSPSHRHHDDHDHDHESAADDHHH